MTTEEKIKAYEARIFKLTEWVKYYRDQNFQYLAKIHELEDEVDCYFWKEMGEE